jgi:hypothetical protein
LFFIATFEAFLPFSRNRKKPCVEADFVSLAGNFFALFAAANRFCKLYNFSAAGFFVRFFGRRRYVVCRRVLSLAYKHGKPCLCDDPGQHLQA